MTQRFLVLLSLLFVATLPAHAYSEQQDDDLVVLSGRVKDEHGAAVPKADVILKDQDVELGSDTTDKNGAYEIKHRPMNRCTIYVIPGSKSGWAQTIMPHIRADESRHMMITVRRGFAVEGRVVSRGQPLKGVLVRATSDDKDAVHTGGEAFTDRQGRFHMTLTPGEKTFEVHNKLWKHASGLYRHKLPITGDGTIPDLSVPSSLHAGAI